MLLCLYVYVFCSILAIVATTYLVGLAIFKYYTTEGVFVAGDLMSNEG